MSIKRRNSISRNRRNGLLFISPWLIGLALFVVYPVGSSFYYSLCSYDIIQAPRYVGLDNYRTLILKDPLFWKGVYNTLFYAIFHIPLNTIWGISVALLLNTKVKGRSIFRAIFYIPSIVPVVASSIVWQWFLNPQYGLVNSLLSLLGITGPGWITDPAWAKPSLIIMGLWGFGQSMVIYLASLQDVPKALYEAAEIDGASGWHKVRHITLPMISPVILFNVIMGTISAFQYFTQAYVMTGGGPADSTLFYSLYLYNNAFRYYKMGYASALAWILFVLVILATIGILESSARWVYYRGTE
jgi:multiple sugar transport system permease protein